MAVSQDSIDSINDTIVTQPIKSSQPPISSSSASASEKILNGTISSGTTITKPPLPPQPLSASSSSYERSSNAYAPSFASMQQQQPEPNIAATFESYRPPLQAVSHERINPFDKGKPPVAAATAAAATEIKETVFKPDLTSVAGFDYSYKPPTTTAVPPAQPIVEEKPKARPEFERKLSDADIIFGEIKKAQEAYKQNYARNRSNSSFTSTSTDSDYVYGTRDNRRENSFQKSLSVSSDKDGDFTHDPTILSNRSGVCNDAFSDFDSPSIPASQTKKSWSNIDDEYDLK